MNRLYETMTRVQIGGYTVRVWRTCAGLNSGPDDDVVSGLAELPLTDLSMRGISDALDNIMGVEAYEILDAHGNGALVYPDWK